VKISASTARVEGMVKKGGSKIPLGRPKDSEMELKADGGGKE
jgi:hypothetical protein